jgi:hypothetical protein
MAVEGGQDVRLLYVIDSLGHGGAEKSLVEMLPEYRRLGVDTTVVCLVDRDTELVTTAREAGAEVAVAPPVGVLRQAFWVRRQIRRRRPDIVHTTLFRADLVGRLSAFGMPTPLLTSLVNTQYEPDRVVESGIAAWKLWVARELERWTGRFATDHFHVNSLAVLRSAESRLGIPERKMTVIPRGRNPQCFSPSVRNNGGPRERVWVSDQASWSCWRLVDSSRKKGGASEVEGARGGVSSG